MLDTFLKASCISGKVFEYSTCWRIPIACFLPTEYPCRLFRGKGRGCHAADSFIGIFFFALRSERQRVKKAPTKVYNFSNAMCIRRKNFE